MTYNEAKVTIESFFDTILNELWLTTEQRKGLSEALDLACDALEKQASSYDECKLAAIRGILVNYAKDYEKAACDFLEEIIDVIGMSSKDLFPDRNLK